MKWIIVIILSIVALSWGIWTAIGVFILGSIIISIIKTMFKNPGNYFLSIFFEWKDIFRILEVPESQQDNFKVSEEYKHEHPGTEGRLNSFSALFEYYIIPNSLRDGSYSYSSIYDQQLKRFFEIGINYGDVLKNSKKDSYLTCFFSKNLADNKAGFKVSFYGSKNKAIIFLFDKNYLNLKDANVKWGDRIPFESFKISYASYVDFKADNTVEKVSVSPDVLWINTEVQSQYDAQSVSFDSDLHKFFKK